LRKAGHRLLPALQYPIGKSAAAQAFDVQAAHLIRAIQFTERRGVVMDSRVAADETEFANTGKVVHATPPIMATLSPMITWPAIMQLWPGCSWSPSARHAPGGH